MPQRGAWNAPVSEPEPCSWDNQVLLPDGRTSYGVFMPGAGWYVRDRFLDVLGWRKLDNRQITCGRDLRSL